MRKMLAQRLTGLSASVIASWEFGIEDDSDDCDLVEKIYDSAVEAGLATAEAWPKGSFWLVRVVDLSISQVVFFDRVFYY